MNDRKKGNTQSDYNRFESQDHSKTSFWAVLLRQTCYRIKTRMWHQAVKLNFLQQSILCPITTKLLQDRSKILGVR